jgi:rod shape-determining protein MreC
VHDNRRNRLVLGALLLVAIILITLDFRDGGASPARNAGAGIFGPIESVTHDVTDPVASLFDSITGGPSAQGSIASLQRENAELRAELSQAQLSKADSSMRAVTGSSPRASSRPGAITPTRSRWARAAMTELSRTRRCSTVPASSAPSPE